jgi:hypothetical protein
MCDSSTKIIHLNVAPLLELLPKSCMTDLYPLSFPNFVVTCYETALFFELDVIRFLSGDT